MACRASGSAEASELVETQRGRPGKARNNSHISGRHSDRLAKIFGVNNRYLEHAHELLEKDLGAAARVKAGEIPLKVVYESM
jgi:hypothetical protein